MWVAIQNLRAYNVTYEKGGEYETLPKGYENCFKKVVKRGLENAETSSISVPSEKRSKKNSRQHKRASNAKRGKNSSKGRS